LLETKIPFFTLAAAGWKMLSVSRVLKPKESDGNNLDFWPCWKQDKAIICTIGDEWLYGIPEEKVKLINGFNVQ